MREMTSMALVVPERDRPSPKVWQPWYMEGEETLNILVIGPRPTFKYFSSLIRPTFIGYVSVIRHITTFKC